MPDSPKTYILDDLPTDTTSPTALTDTSPKSE